MPRISVFHDRRNQKYGFTLSYQKISRTFISENREEILKWFKALSNIGVQTRINKFYSFKENILSNDNYKVVITQITKAYAKDKKMDYIIKTFYKSAINNLSSIVI